MKTDNELIAEFRGLPRTGEPDSKSFVTRKGNTHLNSLEYHTSWDWLMPVVEKIQDVEIVKNRVKRTAANVQIFYKACFIEYSPDEESGDDNGEFKIQTKGDTKLEAVYKAVVEFIKWYNSQEQKQH
jgi:hypothetical protein